MNNIISIKIIIIILLIFLLLYLVIYNINYFNTFNKIEIDRMKFIQLDSFDFYNNILIEKLDNKVNNILNNPNIDIYNILFILQAYNSLYSIYYMDDELDNIISYFINKIRNDNILSQDYIIVRNISLINIFIDDPIQNANSFQINKDDIVKYLISYVDIIFYNNNNISHNNKIICPDIFIRFYYYVYDLIDNFTSIKYLNYIKTDVNFEYNSYFSVISLSNIILDNTEILNKYFCKEIYINIVSAALIVKYYASKINKNYTIYILNNNNDIIYKDQTDRLIKRKDFIGLKMPKIIHYNYDDNIIIKTSKYSLFSGFIKNNYANCYLTSVNLIYKNPFDYSFLYWNNRYDIPGSLYIENILEYKTEYNYSYHNYDNKSFVAFRIYNIKEKLTNSLHYYIKEGTFLNKNYLINMMFIPNINRYFKIVKNIDVRLIGNNSIIKIDKNQIIDKVSRYMSCSSISIIDNEYGNIRYIIKPTSQVSIEFEKFDNYYYINISIKNLIHDRLIIGYYLKNYPVNNNYIILENNDLVMKNDKYIVVNKNNKVIFYDMASCSNIYNLLTC
jgi:hypothetical protein